MTAKGSPVPAAAVLLAVAFLLCAGCTSIPGPDARFTPLPTTTMIPMTPQVKATSLMLATTPVTTSPFGSPAATPSPAVTTTAPQPAATASPDTFETRTCAEQGGSVAEPGQACPGTWIAAGDTFNCCSAAPVRDSGHNVTVTIAPLDVVIVMDDDPGPVVP